MFMRSYCLYNGNYVDIAEIYEVRDGKQINIPEKLKYYRKLSNNRQLFCACGCGEVVILVAGDRNLRKQHFRSLHQFTNSNCEYQEESDISIKSKIMLKCWLNNNLPEMEHEIRYRVPISQLVENRRRYELSMYSKDYDIGILYHKHISSMLEEKIELLSEYMKSKIIYVTGIENEETEGQYPEHMMRIQEAQGYCFYLNLTSESLYEEVEAKVSIYVKTYYGLWKNIDVCVGMLDDFELNVDGTLVYKGDLVSNLVDKRKRIFQIEQECKLEQIKKREEEARLRQERERQESEERVWREKERRVRLEEEKRKQREIEKQKEREEKQRREEEEIKKFLTDYPKLARIYDFLKELKSIKGEFVSDQSDGKKKNIKFEQKIEKLEINRRKHRIEISDNNMEKAYIYILERGFSRVNIPGTGVLYKVIDYTRISDVEKNFMMSFICIFKEDSNDVECSVSEIKCQFLSEDNVCAYENRCTYQKR